VRLSWSKLSCVLPCISGARVRSWRKNSNLRRNRIVSRDLTAVPYIPPRPPELDHLTDEAASAALARHYGNFTLAARELGVDAKLLRRLFWNNPRIMDTSAERTELFHSMVIGELVVQLNSRSYGKYLRAAAELVDYPTIRPVPGLGKLLTRDIKPGKPRGRHARKPAPVNVDAVVEREVESKLEHARERERESVDASARVIERAPAGLILDSWPANSKYASVRGLTRGRR
jgi:hypothetical protein